ncbi:Peptidyl-prolyl cis-trans isomerase (fragment) [Clostridium neonatale]
MVADAPHLDGQYASFGKVIEGLEVADNIVAQKTDVYDRPYEDQVIKSMTVDMHGEAIEEPEIIEE